jgi:1,4-dihydroxy-6-naphthoate synthase
MHYAIAGKVDTGGFAVSQVPGRHREASTGVRLDGRLEVSAISIHAYAHLSRRYALMACRGEHGTGGPIVVAREPLAAGSSRGRPSPFPAP